NLGFTKVGCVHINDPYGVAFKDGVSRAAEANGMEAFTAALEVGIDTVTAVSDIVEASSGEVNAWVGVLFDAHLDNVMRDAISNGAGGGDNVWIFTDGLNNGDLSERAVGGTGCVDDDCEDIAAALNGVFRIVATQGVATEGGLTLYDRFVDEWAGLDSNTGFQRELAKKALRYTSAGIPYVADGGGKNMDGTDMPIPIGTDLAKYHETFFENSLLSAYEGFFYDGSIQMGLGACKALKDNGANFTVDASGDEEMTKFADMLYAGMTSITFEGWSGNVVFDERKISTLEAELTLLKEYDQREKDMIDKEITGFRTDFMEHRDKNKAASTERAELDKFLIPAAEVTPVKMIGKGSFGEVFLASYRGQQVAVKTMSSIDADNLSRFRDEIILMSDLHHPNVVFMVGACWEQQLMALVLEFCDKGTASDCLAPDLTWGDPLFKWAKDIALGIGYLHNISFFDTKNNVQVSNIIHRDIKPDNCLVTDTYGVKVSDFGEARMADAGKTMTMVGTPFYVAPEVIRGDHYSVSADVYSYAMTLVCFATRRTSLGEWLKKAYRDEKMKKKRGLGGGGGAKATTISDNRVAHLMCNKQWRPSEGLVEDLKVPSKMGQLIELCWLDNPELRPDFKEIKAFLVDQCMEQIMGSDGTGNGTG
ncbi:hypothetical protein TrRE_jg1047, partial [Triparma retinervis]